MTKPAIKVEGLWKEYVVGSVQQTHSTFYDLLSHSLKAPFKRLRNLGGTNDEVNQFWALKDVNFEVQSGEVLGVIGRNGAGKSTLLKILSRITAPSRGRVTVQGRIASLLEVGTGFHPELSGRENIFLNGAILGMSQIEIRKKFDEIVEFSGVGRFVDTPVKHYSSGMYVRLAFSVAAHLDSDVLVVDEVLAVGDGEFQKKCLGSLNDMAKNGRTVLLVSHNIAALSSLCRTSVVLDRGGVVHCGDISSGLKVYAAMGVKEGTEIQALFSGGLASDLRVDSVQISQNDKDIDGLVPSLDINISILGQALHDLGLTDIAVAIYYGGQRLFTILDSSVPSELPKGRFESIFTIPSYTLRPGTYHLALGARRSHGNEWMWATDVSQLVISEIWDQRCEYKAIGAVNINGSSRRFLRGGP